jgi:hypothetical protein
MVCRLHAASYNSKESIYNIRLKRYDEPKDNTTFNVDTDRILKL